MPPNPALQLTQFVLQFLVSRKNMANTHKSPDNKYTHLNSPGAVKHIRSHDGAVLREYKG